MIPPWNHASPAPAPALGRGREERRAPEGGAPSENSCDSTGRSGGVSVLGLSPPAPSRADVSFWMGERDPSPLW